MKLSKVKQLIKVEQYIYKDVQQGDYYFIDETEMYNGPFPSLETARDALNEYCAQL